MECRLKYAKKPWRGQVKLRWERDVQGSKLEKVREEKFGPVLSDEEELETMLKRAQLAILNPNISSKNFVHLDLSTVKPNTAPIGDAQQLSFSTNVVCVDIESELVTDLSFIDLPGEWMYCPDMLLVIYSSQPGIISNVSDGEDESSIGLIKDMITSSIQGNTLILLAISMRGKSLSSPKVVF